MSVCVKICGVTSVADAKMAVGLGADAVGVNFVVGSKRLIDTSTAAAIVGELGDSAAVVGVVADQSVSQLRHLREASGVGLLQLHGDETPELVEALQPNAFKALRVATAADVDQAARFGGDRILVDAKVPGTLGGTGHTFDWDLVRELARSRRVLLAGGLTPENVAEAVRLVRPWGVDVASGVEVDGDARRKDPEKVARLIERAREA